MKWYWSLAFLACVVLSGAAVWMGGLNQDEGWYLYAANLVAEGRMPYRDFFYTQGPLLPIVYSAFTGIWQSGGLLAARLFNLGLGLSGIVLAVALAYRLSRSAQASIITFFLLATNLYHLYYLTIPKTYALAGLFVIVGFYLLSFINTSRSLWLKAFFALTSGLSLAFAAGARISLGVILAVVGLGLLLGFRRYGSSFFWFGLGGVLGLAAVYGPILFDEGAYAGLVAAQRYHATRSGSDLVWTVGSISRLVRWYLPVFIVLGLGLSNRSAWTWRTGLLLASFFAVFGVQLLAPFPYEDYQVPIMGILAVVAAISIRDSSPSRNVLLVLGLCFATSFGSPLLEKWATNGQDRFWSLKKTKTELAQLREVAERIKSLDPSGKMLLTQDLYLAIELNRKVPKGLEMGPFAILDDAQWRKLLGKASQSCAIAALSGYTFAIEPPACTERPLEQQLAYWQILESSYEPAFREEAFGQNATPLLVLKRKVFQ